jgi:hypothetical protein
MNTTHLKCALALAALATAFACSQNDGGPSAPLAGDAGIRFVHASPSVGAVDIYVAGNKVISGVAYGRSSAAKVSITGREHVTLRSSTTVVDELDASFAAGDTTAIVLTQDSAEVTPVEPDTGRAAGNRANIRIINVVSPGTPSPTLLDVLIHAPGLSADSVPKLGMDASIASYGPLMYFDPGSFRFQFVPHGGNTILADVTFDVAAGEKRSIVLERQASGEYKAQVVVEP